MRYHPTNNLIRLTVLPGNVYIPLKSRFIYLYGSFASTMNFLNINNKLLFSINDLQIYFTILHFYLSNAILLDTNHFHIQYLLLMAHLNQAHVPYTVSQFQLLSLFLLPMYQTQVHHAPVKSS